MPNDIWINLPIKDLAKSKEFFTTIGFPLNPGPGNSEQSACFAIGDKKVILMLFTEPAFAGFTKHAAADTSQGTEVLFSIGATSRGQVDEIAAKAVAAGGALFGEPQEIQGWMYGCGFCDLDGHRWNALFMDTSKLPQP